MYYFDAHCDTLSTGRNLWENKGHFDLSRAIERGDGIQVMAAFGKGKEEQLSRMRRIIPLLPNNFHVIGSVEGGEDIDEVSDVALFHRSGMQMLGLTWNEDNQLAGGCYGKGMGLTLLGKEVVEICEEMDILIDLAHAHEKTFWDVFTVIKKPPVVSHACCSSLCLHRRNITDAQIRALAERGGVFGITFCPDFLNVGGCASIGDVVAHILHAVNAGGIESVGIGSDFDGCDKLPDGIEGVQDILKLAELLPFSDDYKEKIMGGNFGRLMTY